MKKIFLTLVFFLFVINSAFAGSTVRFDPFDGSWREPGTYGITQYFIHSGASTLYKNGSPEVRDIDINANIGVTTFATWQDIGPVPLYFSLSLSYGGVSVNDGFGLGTEKAAGLGDTSFNITGRALAWEDGFFNISFTTGIPTGIYDHNSTANMGENRWTFTPGIDISHMVWRFNFDFHAGYVFATDNNRYTTDKFTLRTEGEIYAETHVSFILSEKVGAYLALGAGGVWGARQKVEGNVITSNRNDYGVKLAIGAPITENIDFLVHYLQDVYVADGPLNYQVQMFVNVVF